MIPKGFKRPQITEITEEKEVCVYLVQKNEIELSTEYLYADSRERKLLNRMFMRHEIVHALDNHHG